jgi:hypothetical protein
LSLGFHRLICKENKFFFSKIICDICSILGKSPRAGDFMAIVTKGSGGSIKFTGTGGGINIASSGGGGGGVVTMIEESGTQTIGAGDSFIYGAGWSATLSSTYASQAYTISTSDASYNAVSQIASGNMNVNLNTINFGDYYGSTHSETYDLGEWSGTQRVFIATASGVSFKIKVRGGIGGGGFGGGGFGGGPS